MGSAATALRDVPIEPADLDIAMPTPTAVYAAAGHLPSHPDRPPADDPDDWYSSVAKPIRAFVDHAGSRWTFGRWTLCDTKVELAHIDLPGTADLLGETFGDAVWTTRTVIRWKGVPIPVVPLEAQLATMMLRQQHHRSQPCPLSVSTASI